MENIKISMVLILLLTVSICRSQVLGNSMQKASIGSTSLNQILDSLFANHNNKTSPGYAISIFQNGKPVVKKNYGMASIELGVPFSHQTVVSIPYSEGREFIAVAAALLEHDGKLSLEDKVRKYFPRLPAWAEPVTIQSLLNHSSGFCDEWATLVLTQAEMNNRLDVSQFLNFLYRQPEPQIEPEKGYMYSNSDFGLLRLILEKASGEKLPDYMQRRIFEPLKMNATLMQRDKEEVIANHALPYVSNGPGKYKLWLRDKTSPGGNYFILTTANDLEKWATACTDKNSFIAKAFARLKARARPIPVLEDVHYVFGHTVKKIGSYEVTMHQGVNGIAYLTHIAEAKLTIICLSNDSKPTAETISLLVDKVMNNGKGTKPALEKFPVVPIPVSKADLSRYAGHYVWSEPTFQSYKLRNMSTTFTVNNDTLQWVYEEDDVFPVLPVGQGVFKDPEYPIWIVFKQLHPDSLTTATFHIQEVNPQIIVAKRDTVVAKVLSREFLQKLEGKYYNEHLDYYWTLELDNNGKIIVKRPTIADQYLEPQPNGEFKMKTEYHAGGEASSVRLTFYFNDRGDPIYFNAHHSRLMNCRFQKQ